ncbi:kunitz-type protease inhibitor 2 isoform X2 [Engystomops pustulosus]|uniref:kunitz-type protease inhibitor 2 isoform X2 n=1 Tax=Engystomops pustulosus TaxID=76066 RepID=UPI003AFB66BF
MAPGLLLLVLLVPLAMADPEPPCDGFQVRDGWGLEDVELPQLGVKALGQPEDMDDERTCWQRCCDRAECDLAELSSGKCYLRSCSLNGLDVCALRERPGARTYKRSSAGAAPVREAVKSEQPEPPSKRMASPNSLSDECSGPGVTGNCRAAFPRWYFDAESMSCQSFIYGGCGGSKNNHLSKEDCISKCVAPKPEPAKVHAPKKESFKDYCAAPAVTGPCRAAFTRWFFDHESSSCKTFTYGGCKANKNNYFSEAECLNMCSGRTEEDDDFADHSVMHRPMAAVVLPVLLALLAAALIGVMILFFVKVLRKNQEAAGFRAMWTPIDDKECLMNNAYSL